ncbi:MAG: hypothetical protein LC731_08325, partial [Acidobacteria bacterium]|nr:hypothetical protein [Acidobacteriota bacterium]
MKKGRGKVKIKTVLLTALILVASFVLFMTASCQTATENRNASANTTTNSNTTQNTTSTNQTEVAKKDETATAGGSLATPTETYKTGYEARQKKDVATLKRVLSKDALAFLTEVGKEEKKTLDDQLKAMAERPQAATAETRNEKINGDRATLEYLNDKGAWSTMHFAKEGNDWKIDLPKAQ